MSRPDQPAARGWLFLPSAAVPERWRERAVSVALVPLLPEEARTVLAGEAAVPELDPQEVELARLAVSGATTATIARELSVSTRAVQYRLARLRDRFGVRSTAELAAYLAGRGFTGRKPSFIGNGGADAE